MTTTVDLNDFAVQADAIDLCLLAEAGLKRRGPITKIVDSIVLTAMLDGVHAQNHTEVLRDRIAAVAYAQATYTGDLAFDAAMSVRGAMTLLDAPALAVVLSNRVRDLVTTVQAWSL
jgi:hypothetical protein